MKQIILPFALFLMVFTSYKAQEALDINEAVFEHQNKLDFQLGNGMSFNFDDSAHLFHIGGMIQSSYIHNRFDSENIQSQNSIGIKRSYFNMSGRLNEGLFSFLIQTNFSESSALLDAWVAYHPLRNLHFYFGQKMTPMNNLSMQYMENNLQFSSRNYLSQNFSTTGREFGLFIESNFKLGKIGVEPKLAITSGDGMNSFGENSLDADVGGFKYGGRLNIYPLGYFKKGNTYIGHDLLREEKPKILVGASSSLNMGASHKVGEGHYSEDLLNEGTFLFYDKDSIGLARFPNYLKNNLDFCLKYKGLSMLIEYVNTAAYNLQGTALNNSATVLLDTTQISEYMVLGNAYSVQLGYIFNKDISLDFRYGQSFKEFGFNSNSVLKNYDELAIGITKYFSGRAVKAQLFSRYLNFYENVDLNQLFIEFLLQIQF